MQLVKFGNEISLTDSCFECSITAAGAVWEVVEVWGTVCWGRPVTKLMSWKVVLHPESTLASLLLWMQ